MARKNKKSKKENKNSSNEKNRFFIVIRNIEFTFLEDCILKIIKKFGHASDEKIAEILCFDDVSSILTDEGLKNRVEGDSSRRTLKSGWDGKEFAILKKEKNKIKYFKLEEKEQEEKQKLFKNLNQLKNEIEKDNWENENYCDFYDEYLEKINNLKELNNKEFPKELKKERAEKILELA